MAWVPADWTITRSTKNIRYIGDGHAGASPSYVTGIELHRELQDLADDASFSGDDEMSIIDQTPSERGGVDTNITLLNGYNIDDTAAEHIYDTSITQDGGDTIYDGIQVFGNATSIQIVQNGALIANDFWNEAKMIAATEDSASNTTHRFMVKVRTGGADIDGRRLLGTQRVLGTVYTEFFIGGGTNRGNNVLALTANNDGNNGTAAGTIATWTDIVNDNEGYVGIDADGDSTNEFYYSDWELGTRTKNQFYERAKWIQREGTSETLYGLDGDIFRGITHEINIDTPSGTFQEPEAVSWTGGTGQLLAIDSTTAGTKMWIQLLTGTIPGDNVTITGGTSSATCLVNVTVTPRLISLPFVGVSTGSAINPGAYGLGIGADDLTVNDLVVDLTDTNRTPPNNVTWTYSGVVSGEDRLLVGPRGYLLQYDNEASGPFTDGETLTFGGGGTATLRILTDDGSTGSMLFVMVSGNVPADGETITGGTSSATADVDGDPIIDIDLEQMTLNGALTGAAVTSVVVNGSIPTDTPTSAGTTSSLRILRADGTYSLHRYTSYTGSTFTIPSHDFSTNNAANGAGCFVGYIDKAASATSESFTSVYSSDRDLIARNRDGGVTPTKPSSVPSTLTSSGGGVTAQRLTDE